MSAFSEDIRRDVIVKSTAFKIFISYSRSDMSFADRLVGGLEARAFKCTIDRRDLEYGERWQALLRDFIRDADTVVFIVSPRSIASQWCRWELAEVARASKRLIPIVLEPVQINQLPPEISAVHLMPFHLEMEFQARLQTLCDILLKDRNWIQEHTRLSLRSLKWDSEGRKPDVLLRGIELSDAENWKSSTRTDNLAPDALLEAYISESRASSVRTQKLRTRIASAAAVVALLLSAVAIWQGLEARISQSEATRQRDEAERQRNAAVHNEQIATAQRREAEEQRLQADEQRRLAEANERQAAERRDEALVNQSRYLTDLARQQLQQGDPVTAALIALEAHPWPATRIVRPDFPSARSVMELAIAQQLEQWVLPLGAFADASYSPDGRWIAIADDEARIRIVTLSGEIKSEVRVDAPRSKNPSKFVSANTVQFTSDGTSVVHRGLDSSCRVFEVSRTGALRQAFEALHSTVDCRPTQHGRFIAVTFKDKPNVIEVKDIADGNTTRVIDSFEGGFELGVLSGAGNRLTIDAEKFFHEGGRVIREVPEPEMGFRATSFSIDKKLAFSFGSDSSVIWNVADGATLRRIPFDPGTMSDVYAAVFSSDSKMLATASKSGLAKVWDVSTGALISTFFGHSEEVIGVEFGAEDRSVVTLGADSTLRFWNPSTGKPIYVARWGAPPDSPGLMRINPDARYVVIGQPGIALRQFAVPGPLRAQGTLKLDAPTSVLDPNCFGSRTDSSGPFKASPFSAYVSPQARYVASIWSDGRLRIHDTASGALIRDWEISKCPKLASIKVKWNEDDDRLALFDGAFVREYCISPQTCRHGMIVNLPSGHERDNILGFRYRRSVLELISSNKLSFQINDGGANKVIGAWWSGRSRIVARGLPNEMYLAASGSALFILTPTGNIELKLDEQKESFFLSSCLESGRISITHLAIDMEKEAITVLCGNEAFRRTRSGLFEKVIFEDRISQGSPDYSLLGDGRKIVRTLFVGDGELGGTKEVAIWDTSTGASLYTLGGHSSNVTAVSNSSQFVITTKSEKEEKFWDAISGALLFSGVSEYPLFSLLRERASVQISWTVQPNDGKDLSELVVRRYFYDRHPNRSGDSLVPFRCLTLQQRKSFALDAVPPEWCITGLDKVDQTNPDAWRPLWPYQSGNWREWLVAKRSGRVKAIPTTDAPQ